MPGWLKEDTATTVKFGPFVDVSDGATLETGLTLSTTNFRLSKNGGNYAAKNSTTATSHDENGDYDVSLSATDTNTAGRLRMIYKSTAALVVWDEWMVLPANVYDSLVAGTDNLDINLVQLGGSTQSQADLKDFADAGYDPSGNRVNAVLTAGSTISMTYANATVGTVTTLTGHTAQTGDNFARLGAPAGASVSADIAAIEAQTDDIGVAGAGLTGIPWNAAWDAEVQSEVQDALEANHLDHLLAVAGTTATIVNESFFAQLVSASTTASFSSYDNTTDSLEAIRNRGDAAWITGGGGGITDIVNVQPLIPLSIDLANTATVRLSLMLINSLDDLPSTAEITPGTISIHRKAIGGTSWTAVVTDAACSEQAGEVYYDEVFDSGTGYAEGDSIRITFKSQKITVAANDYEIIDANGRFWYTSVRQTMRGTDSALLAANVPTNFSSMTISTGGTVDAKLVAGSTISMAYANLTIGTVTANTDMRGTDSALLAASAPTNWSNMALTTGGVVDAKLAAGSTASLTYANLTVGTVTANTDMRGTDSAFLAASAPTNFSSLNISTGGVAQANVITSASTARGVFADSFLTRGLATGATTGTRTVQNALRALRNRVDINGTTGTVYQENDTTAAWTFTATRASTTTQPLIEVNPA